MIKERELKDLNNQCDDSHTIEGLKTGDAREDLNQSPQIKRSVSDSDIHTPNLGVVIEEKHREPSPKQKQNRNFSEIDYAYRYKTPQKSMFESEHLLGESRNTGPGECAISSYEKQPHSNSLNDINSLHTSDKEATAQNQDDKSGDEVVVEVN